MLRKKTAAYALLAVYEIAHQQQGASDPLGVRAGDIAQKHKLPKAYAAKILSQLASAGVLHSDRGPRGGFRLSRPVDKISLFDVFQGVGVLAPPRSRGPIVKGLPIAVQAVLDRTDLDASNALRDLFMRTTLADLLKAGSNTPPIRQPVPSLV
jgi:Rrf2 family protein